jgi:hypothetical protein
MTLITHLPYSAEVKESVQDVRLLFLWAFMACFKLNFLPKFLDLGLYEWYVIWYEFSQERNSLRNTQNLMQSVFHAT